MDQSTFFVTVTHLMPRARVAIRHLKTHVNVDNVKTRVKGFRILVSEGKMQLAIHALMLTETALA